MIKSRKLRKAGHVARTGERRGACRVLWLKLREGDQLENPGVDGRMILKWMFEKWVGDMDWIDLAQDSDKWRAVVKLVINNLVP